MTQQVDREKEAGFFASDPARAVERDSAAGDHAVQVRMQMQILTPGVEHGEEADGGAEQPRFGGGFEQALSGRAKQDLVNLLRVLERQPSDLRGQSEHDVEIGNGQKLRFALREPARASLGLALRAVPVATRVIYDDAMSAAITLLDAPAEGRR